MGATDNRLAVEAVEYIRKNWPWWDRHGGGGRHILIHTGDMGRIESEQRVQSVLSNATWLTHWGLTKEHKYARWKESHRPGKDIVIPIFLQPGLVDGYGMRTTPLHPAIQNSTVQKRTQTFFFAGRICGDRKKPVPGVWPNCLVERQENDGYSAGTRQKVFYYHGNRTSYQIVTSTSTYGKDMARSRFCLAPTGGGHGKRNIIVTLAGCIPVLTTDNVMQPFEPELDWGEFSIPVLESEIPKLHKILESMSEEKVKQKQSQLWCAAQHIFWGSIYGGLVDDEGRYDAFETTMEILRMKIKYPALAPQDYVKKDEDFRKFISCNSAPRPEVPELCTASKVPSLSSSIKCEQCRTRTATGKVFLMPGGAICCDEKKLAKCPRLWD